MESEDERHPSDQAVSPAGRGADFLSRLADRAGGATRAEAVYAPPVERGGVTVIPVAKVRWGGGRRFEGEDSDRFGGGLVASPAGFIELREGSTRYTPIAGRGRLALAAAGGALAALVLERALGSHPRR